MELKITNSFVQDYLEYAKETESPEIFHMWSGLSAISACLGQHVYTDFGLGPIHPNMYVVLVGPPGVRKSTAINWAKKRLKAAVNLEFAPTDTAGQRQGLMSAFLKENPKEDSKVDESIVKAFSDINLFNQEETFLDMIGEVEDTRIRVEDKETLYGMFNEFDSMIGQKQREMLTFLINLWDMERYVYRLAKTSTVLEQPMFSFLAATTPSSISESLPPGSGSSGFLSRLIFVFSEATKKKIADPQPPEQELCDLIEEHFSSIARNCRGCIKRTDKAKALLEEIYLESKSSIEDPRFIYYVQRRYTHLIKLCLLLAVARKSSVITPLDVEEGLILLEATEKEMHKALGQFGTTPIGLAQQEVLDMLDQGGHTTLKSGLFSRMTSRFKIFEIEQAISNLITLGRIKTKGQDGPNLLIMTSTHVKEELIQEQLIQQEQQRSVVNLDTRIMTAQ